MLENRDRNLAWRRPLLTALIILSVIQQIPFVTDSYYSEIRLILYIGFGVLAIASLIVSLAARSTLLPMFGVAIVYLAVVTVTASLITGYSSFQELSLYLVPFLTLFISTRMAYTSHELKKLLLSYVATVVVVGTLIVAQAGFAITDVYAVTHKNQVGPMIGFAAVIALNLLVDGRTLSGGVGKVQQGLLLGAVVLLVLSLLVARNRSGIVALLLVGTLVLARGIWHLGVSRRMVLVGWAVILIGVVGAFGAYGPLFDMVWQSLTGNYDVTNLESLSAGRTDTYGEAFAYFLRHPVLGSLGSPVDFDGTPHNYLLNTLVNFGAVGGLSLIILFGVLVWTCVRGITSPERGSVQQLAAFILLFSLIVSMFEYTYPYGPGTTQLILWVLLGQVGAARGMDPITPELAESERRAR